MDEKEEKEAPEGEKEGLTMKEKVILTLKKLESESNKDVKKGLSYIRNKVIEREKGIEILHEVGGTSHVLRALSSNSEEIQSLSLSILGNCCCRLISNESFCDELVKFGLANKISGILKKSTSPKVQQRVFRLVGNMAQSNALARELHKANIIMFIVPILGSTNCNQVKETAVRAIRWLWETDRYHLEMFRIAAVKTVASLLETDNEHLCKLVLRTLVVFTQPCSDLTAAQISGNGNGYATIVSKISSTVVSVLICNLSHSPRARVELSKAGVVPSIIQQLESGKKIDSYLILSLCLLCRESMIRASLRKTNDGFKTILSLLMNPKAKHYYPELMSAIAQFNYDKPSLIIMMRLGLINVLIEKLSEYTKEHDSRHEEAVVTFVAPLSPASPPSFWSSPSPPPNTSRSESESGMYSPRCSSPESDSGASDIIPSKTILDTYPESQLGLDGCVIEVLSQLTYMKTPIPALASKLCINTILDYMVGLRFPQSRQNFLKATKALCSIVKCKHYFNLLLEEETILAIDRSLCREVHSECWECKRLEETGREVLSELGTSAQSGLGEGELTYRLTLVTEHVKESVSLAIPHVIKQPNLLNTLLFGHNALKRLLNAMKSRVDEAVPSLHSLFNTLCIKNPQNQIQICQNCEVTSMRKESNISFSLDDGSRVLANKESLSHSCPVFEAMFRGGFVESQQNTVHITDMSSACLTHLTRIIDEYCSCVLPKDLPTLLELISATDRFLLPELSAKILNVVVNSTLSHATCSAVYEWGVTVGRQLSIAAEIPHQVIKYLFSSEMPSCFRVNAAKLILDGSCTEIFTKDLTDIIIMGVKDYTKNRRSIYNRMV